MLSASPSSDCIIDDAALVIIGAGFSGLNALISAREYIPAPAKIVLADERGEIGGLWVDTYDFVRLHQPYAFYTAFDAPWETNYPCTHLATRPEVKKHFADLARRGDATTLLSHRYISHAVDDSTPESGVLVTLKRVDEERKDEIVQVRTKKLIIATPISNRNQKPFVLSAGEAVKSITIDNLSKELSQPIEEGRNFVIIGSGKCAMDAIFHIQGHPNVDISGKDSIEMVSGSGTAFFNREKFFPENPIARHFFGITLVAFLCKYSLKWDGTNHREILRLLIKKGLLHTPVDDPKMFVFGMVGGEEMSAIKRAINTVIKGHLVDVIAEDGNLSLVLRDGQKVLLDGGNASSVRNTVIVNCTEIFKENTKFGPMETDGGRVLRPQLILNFPGASTMLLTHAWFLGKLNELLEKVIATPFPVCEKERELGLVKLGALAVHNLNVLINVMPGHVLQRDLSSLASWFPTHRQEKMGKDLVSSYKTARRICEEHMQILHFPKGDCDIANSAEAPVE